jgi:2,5-diketo-D-gluconate reductase B
MTETNIEPIGFGTDGPTTRERDIIETAIDLGYRHLDTADLYENQSAVGEAIERGAVNRDHLFVATKVAHFIEDEITEEYVRHRIEKAFDQLGLDTIDLLYHHWPRDIGDIDTVLPVIEEFIDTGRIRHLGVSNYTIDHLKYARNLIETPIYANQIECHPLLPQEALRRYSAEHEIRTVAYAPFARGRVFDHPIIEEIATQYDADEAAITIAWHTVQDIVPIPSSSTRAHITSNLAATDIDLDAADVSRISEIEERFRRFDPDWMKW